MSLEINFNMDYIGDSGNEILPGYLIETIDDAIAQDFPQVLKLNEEDRKNSMYKAIRFALDCAHITVLYERKVITPNKAPVIPFKQYLIGFRPSDGLCIFTQKKSHKEMLCDGPVRELAKQCILTQSLQYVLIESEEFNVWSYIPVCCSMHETCPYKTRPFDMRRSLFE